MTCTCGTFPTWLFGFSLAVQTAYGFWLGAFFLPWARRWWAERQLRADSEWLRSLHR